MHSFLLVGNNPQPQINQLLKQQGIAANNLDNHPDIVLIKPMASISIKTIRELKIWASRKPYQSPNKAAIIIDSHTATIPAQNALLKTLEEPPPHTIFILSTPNQHLLLPTIVSRCQVIQTGITAKVDSDSPEVNQNIVALIKSLPSLSPAERISRVGEYTKTRNDAMAFTKSLLSTLSQGYYPSQTRLRVIPSAQQLRLCFTAYKQLLANVNPKLVLEHLFLNW